MKKNANYEAVRESTYNRTGQTTPFAEVVDKVDKVGDLITGTARLGAGALGLATNQLWVLGEQPVRTIMAIDTFSLSSGYWPMRASEDRVYDLTQFTTPDSLTTAVSTTKDSDLAVASLTEVANEYRANIGYVPSRLGNWAVAISGISDETQLNRISELLEGLRYSWAHTDSDESGDLHPVALELSDPSVDPNLRLRLLELAQEDADTTGYKGHVWLSQMRNTMRWLANKPNDPLRIEARRRLLLPENDADYLKWQQGQEATRQHESDILKAKNEAQSRQEAERSKRLRDERVGLTRDLIMTCF